MPKITLKEAADQNKTVNTVINLADKSLSASKAISKIGGVVASDALIKTVLNLSGTAFKPARFAARVFGATVLTPCTNVLVDSVYNGYKEAYDKLIDDYEVIIPESINEEEEPNVRAEV